MFFLLTFWLISHKPVMRSGQEQIQAYRPQCDLHLCLGFVSFLSLGSPNLSLLPGCVEIATLSWNMYLSHLSTGLIDISKQI